MTQSFLLQWSVIFLDFVEYFWDFVMRYSDLIIFATMTQSFFRFYQLFLRFRPALQRHNHFATMTKSFLLFCHTLLRFGHVMKSIKSSLWRKKNDAHHYLSLVRYHVWNSESKSLPNSKAVWFYSYITKWTGEKSWQPLLESRYLGKS
jgi:hypothetical protein